MNHLNRKSPDGHAFGWLEQEVDQWILDRIETCRLESI